MKVFISWSGERSQKVAIALDEWLRCVIQAAEPWMSGHIDPGSIWFSEISNKLQDSSVGIICLTAENLNKPWILFEAGALAKGLNSNRVCTLLIDLQPEDVQAPLAQFNHTLPNQKGIFRLLNTLNNAQGDLALEPGILEKVFKTYWPELKKNIEAAINETPESPEPVQRDEQDMLSEILSHTRGIDQRVRQLARIFHSKGRANPAFAI